MSKTKIISICVFMLSVSMIVFLVHGIISSINEANRIEKIEARIIEQLKMIRDAEIAYMAVNGQYTSDWDKLLAFLDTGSFHILEKTETIIPQLYGKDSIVVNIDTLGSILVMDSLFRVGKWPRFDLNTLPYVPGVQPPIKFDIWTDKILKAGLFVNAIEVKNLRPIDSDRNEESDYNTKKPLRFGSRTSVTTAGNWE